MADIYDPLFWRERIYRALAGEKGIHTLVYDLPKQTWDTIQSTHRTVLRSLLSPSESILDAGCGYGALLDILPYKNNDRYFGIDLCQDFIDFAGFGYPGYQFYCADLRYIKHDAAVGRFNTAICRSIDGMVSQHKGTTDWYVIKEAILAKASRIIVLSYEEPANYRIDT